MGALELEWEDRRTTVDSGTELEVLLLGWLGLVDVVLGEARDGDCGLLDSELARAGCLIEGESGFVIREPDPVRSGCGGEG